jgi:hypothetical protein
MKELTSSIPDFEKLIKEGYLYVDKTATLKDVGQLIL